MIGSSGFRSLLILSVVAGKEEVVEVKQNKEFYTFWLLKDAARENLQMLENNSRCNGYARMEAMLLSALAMEAYLNHVGPFLLNSWETIEKSLGPKQKLVLILEVLSHSPSMGHRPYQTFHDMFKFRNLLAHGRTRKVIDHISNQDRIPGTFPEEPKTDIEMLITNEKCFQICNRYD